MEDPTGGWLKIILDQGVAVAVLAFLLIRLESRMAKLEAVLSAMADRTTLLLEAHISEAHGTLSKLA